MLPVSLDVSRMAIALIGKGEKLGRRHDQLIGCGATDITVFEDAGMLTDEVIRAFGLVLAVDIDHDAAARIAALARANRIMINIEDMPDYCDFYYASFIQRGDLMLSVHSKGKSPTLTQRIRDQLALLFPDSWAERLEEMATKRHQWKNEGASMEEIKHRSNQHIDKEGWLVWKKH